jgi:hypothetical protein
MKHAEIVGKSAGAGQRNESNTMRIFMVEKLVVVMGTASNGGSNKTCNFCGVKGHKKASVLKRTLRSHWHGGR